ncbi:MAG: class F sortase [Micrococcaceae bacterium]|nr:class F sortase [Micrococcaceae bacterium]
MNRLPGIAAVALIVLGGATSSVSPSAAGGPLAPMGVATASAPASSSLSPMQRTTPAPAPVQVLPEIQVKDARVKPVAQAPAAPARIRYRGIGADMPASAVGIARDGAMEVPDDAAIAGWYRYSAAPSQRSGSTIIAAHAGSIPTPRGPLYDLRASRAGQEIEIIDTRGAVTRWKVDAVQQLHKETLDLDPYFLDTGERKLVLFTCGGRWDAARQSYEDNIIVTAIPAG